MTSDCPLLDPAVSGRCIAAFTDAQGALDYVSNTCKRSFPRGLDTEVMSMAALDTAHREATLKSEREHVTVFIWRQRERFRVMDVADEQDNSHYRWTVDTPEDFELVTRIYEALYPTNPHFDYSAALALVNAHPDWAGINLHIEQKKIDAEIDT
jgi:spore coat polysaccharide biosynthesis protein SpsF